MTVKFLMLVASRSTWGCRGMDSPQERAHFCRSTNQRVRMPWSADRNNTRCHWFGVIAIMQHDMLDKMRDRKHSELAYSCSVASRGHCRCNCDQIMQPPSSFAVRSGITPGEGGKDGGNIAVKTCHIHFVVTCVQTYLPPDDRCILARPGGRP